MAQMSSEITVTINWAEADRLAESIESLAPVLDGPLNNLVACGMSYDEASTFLYDVVSRILSVVKLT